MHPYISEINPYVGPLFGGAFIGLAAVLLMRANGRIAGISGILGGLMRFESGEFGWRSAFLIGLIISPYVYFLLTGQHVRITEQSTVGIAIVAGLLVGVGTQLGNGCTSGHGVCGTSRFSMRSITATITFIAAGVVTVFVTRHVMGGAV